MPLESSFLRNVQPVQVPDATEVYKQYLNLRDLADQRRYREQQYRAQELLVQQREQEMAEVQNLRQLFAGPTPPTEQDILKVAPIRGQTILREQRQAETARLQQQEQQRKVAQQFREQFINGLHAVANEPDLEKAAQMYAHLQRTMRLTIGNFMTPDLDALISAPMPDEQAMLRLYGAEFGPEKLQELLNKKATAKREERADVRAEEKHAQEITKGALDIRADQLKQGIPKMLAATNQDDWDRARASLPIDLQPDIPAIFSPAAKERVRNLDISAYQQAQLAQQALPSNPDQWIAWKNQPGRTRDEIAMADQIIAAMTKYHQDIRPTIVQDTGGLVTSVLQNPALFQHLSAETKAKIIPDLTARGFTPPPSEAYKKEFGSIQNIRNAVSQYRTLLGSYDRFTRPGTPEFAKLQASFTNLQLRLKDAFQLGAITGPDMTLLNQAVTDPTSLAGRYAGKETLEAQLDVFENVLKSSEDLLRTTHNQPKEAPPAGTAPTQTPQQPKTTPQQPAQPANRKYKYYGQGPLGDVIGSDDQNNWYDVSTGKKII
jgi:hypothetical protein